METGRPTSSLKPSVKKLSTIKGKVIGTAITAVVTAFGAMVTYYFGREPVAILDYASQSGDSGASIFGVYTAGMGLVSLLATGALAAIGTRLTWAKPGSETSDVAAK